MAEKSKSWKKGSRQRRHCKVLPRLCSNRFALNGAKRVFFRSNLVDFFSLRQQTHTNSGETSCGICEDMSFKNNSHHTEWNACRPSARSVIEKKQCCAFFRFFFATTSSLPFQVLLFLANLFSRSVFTKRFFAFPTKASRVL